MITEAPSIIDSISHLSGETGWMLLAFAIMACCLAFAYSIIQLAFKNSSSQETMQKLTDSLHALATVMQSMTHSVENLKASTSKFQDNVTSSVHTFNMDHERKQVALNEIKKNTDNILENQSKLSVQVNEFCINQKNCIYNQREK